MVLEPGEQAVSIEKTPDGRRLVVRRAIAAPESAVWEILTDTEYWPEWGPSITAVDSTVQLIERGTTGRVQVRGGIWLPFEITTCEMYRWTWTVARIPATGHRVESHPDGAIVAFEIPLLAAGYVPICQRACRNIERLAVQQSDAEN